MFERLLALRNDVGLLSEEWDPAAQRQLGNCIVRVPSLEATAAALERHGIRVAGDDLMTMDGDVRAALISGPDGHRFLIEEQAAAPATARARST